MPKHSSKTRSYIDIVSGRNAIIGKCSECEFQTNSPSALKLHKKFIHKKIVPAITESNTNHKCFVCPQIFETEKEVRKHLKVHKVSKK